MEKEPPLPEYLQEQLDEVEKKAAEEERKNPRFDRQKGALIGLFCAGLFWRMLSRCSETGQMTPRLPNI